MLGESGDCGDEVFENIGTGTVSRCMMTKILSAYEKEI